MVFEINKVDRPKIDEVYENSMGELDNFFELGWVKNRPSLILIPDRKTMDALKGEKTEDWVVGWGGRDVYLLSDKNYEKESSHNYSDEEYFKLIKHELAHCFSNVISGFANKPTWLLEGISIYLSGQNSMKKKPGKLENFIEHYDTLDRNSYRESGFVVEFLVEKQGKEKLLELLKKSGNTDSKEGFSELFKSIYGFDLKYENFEVL